jgi:hypothetical protein
MNTPSIGRIVHYVAQQPGSKHKICRAALITAVKDAPNEAHSGIVDLCVFNENGSQFVLDIPFVLASRLIEGSWHWPERVD